MNKELLIKKIILDQFHLDADFSFTDGIRTNDIPGWDSIGWVLIIERIETEFNTSLEFSIFDNVETVDVFVKNVLEFICKK